MKRKGFCRAAVLAFVLIAACPNVFADIIISVVPNTQSLVTGSTVTVELEIAGLGGFSPPALGVFDLNLAFDPTLLSFSNATFGDPVLGDQLDPTGMGNTISFFSSGSGTVELFDLSLDSDTILNSLQPASFGLVSVIFNSIGQGTSPLTLSINAVGDADGNSLSVDLQNGSINLTAVSATPEPATLSMALWAVAVCFMTGLRRKSFLSCKTSFNLRL